MELILSVFPAWYPGSKITALMLADMSNLQNSSMDFRLTSFCKHRNKFLQINAFIHIPCIHIHIVNVRMHLYNIYILVCITKTHIHTYLHAVAYTCILLVPLLCKMLTGYLVQSIKTSWHPSKSKTGNNFWFSQITSSVCSILKEHQLLSARSPSTLLMVTLEDSFVF